MASDAGRFLRTGGGLKGLLGRQWLDEFAALPAGTLIGSFKVEEQIGAGGMGVVFRASRVVGGFDQTVAIKLLLASGAKERERFRAEMEILASLGHPNIAQLVDGGETADGSLYLAMEYIDGVPLDEYCEQHALGTEERIRLLLDIAAALSYAHRNLIIHRDIKPNNILVSRAEGRPKLLDFGIARLFGGADDGSLTVQTFGPMTPIYAAPEQFRGQANTIATDVYQFGVMMFRLVSGGLPYDADPQDTLAWSRAVVEDEPLGLGKAQRRADAGQPDAQRRPARSMPRDLDAIVQTTLKKNPDDRYGSIDLLIADLEAFLSGRPVSARHGGPWYHTQRFLSRHWLASSLAALALVSVLVSGGVAVSQAVVARAEAEKAEQRAAELEVVSRFQAEMLSQVTPRQAGELLTDGINTQVSEALRKSGLAEADRVRRMDEFSAQWQRVNATDAARMLIDRTILQPAVRTIDRDFAAQPAVDATLREAVARRYRELGLYAAAIPLQQRALELRRKVLGDDHPSTLQSIGNLADLLDPDKGKPYYLEAIERSRRVLGPDHPSTLRLLNNVAYNAIIRSDQSSAQQYAIDALERCRRVLGNEHPETLVAIQNMGTWFSMQEQYVDAERLFREALTARRRTLGDDAPDTLSSMNSLGTTLAGAGRFVEAEPFLREAFERRRRVQGEAHPNTSGSRMFLAELLLRQGKAAEAEPLMRESLLWCRRAFGDSAAPTITAASYLGLILHEQGKDAEAIALLHEWESRARDVFPGDDNVQRGIYLYRFGLSQTAVGDFAAAEAGLLEARKIFSAAGQQSELDENRSALVTLYEAWHAQAPGKGFDQKAAEWKGQAP
jgi:eukaryotic-like serine/threonine-protein kinase